MTGRDPVLWLGMATASAAAATATHRHQPPASIVSPCPQIEYTHSSLGLLQKPLLLVAGALHCRWD